MSSGGNLNVANQPLELWDVRQQVQLTPFPGRIQVNLALVFTPDGRSLIGAAATEAIVLWDIESRQERHRLDIGPTAVKSLAVTPDGKLLICPRGEAFRLYHLGTAQEICTIPQPCQVHAVAAAPDGKLVATAGADGVIMLWELRALLPAPAQPAEPLTPAELDALWQDLADDDVARAYRAMNRLVARPQQSVPFLKARLQAALRVDPQRLTRLLADLDDARFAVREQAAAELATLAELAEPALRQALHSKPPLETRKRIDGLLAKLDQQKSADCRRGRWSIEALEHIGTPEAAAVLRGLVERGPEIRWVRDAKGALGRMAP